MISNSMTHRWQFNMINKDPNDTPSIPVLEPSRHRSVIYRRFEGLACIDHEYPVLETYHRDRLESRYKQLLASYNDPVCIANMFNIPGDVDKAMAWGAQFEALKQTK